jgi:lysophospholipase L1-like esterase
LTWRELVFGAATKRPSALQLAVNGVKITFGIGAMRGSKRISCIALVAEGHIFVRDIMKPIFRVWLLCISLAAGLGTGSQSVQSQPAASRFEIPATDAGLPGQGPIRRYDWFRKLWAERRAAWAQRIQQDQHSVVFLGDSITQLWGDEMGGSFGNLKVANRGISGDTTRGVLIRLDDDVIAVHPRGVVLLIGTNDLEEGADPETIVENLKLIIARLEAAERGMPIILCQVFPSSETKKRPAEKIKKINQLYAAAVKGDARVTLVETWPLFADAHGNAKADEFPDLLHPNKTGYAKWAAAIRPILATLGFIENEPDNFTSEPGFKSLFNGKDLTGWGYRQTSEADIHSAQEWQRNDPNAAAWPIVTKPVEFDGKPRSDDGRYVARNGRLIVTTPTEGRKIQALWTTREFPKDFVLKLEFRATPNADSGVFVRDPQLQCRDYLIAGPYKELQHYKPQDWNEMVVEVKGREARCTCNGELLEGALKLPDTGPIGLEGDRGQMEYRHIRIKESP